METLKAKTPAKIVLTRSMSRLQKLKRDTMALIDDVVGGTLGPGGHPVLIERAEHGLPPSITKDGVTVFRALGFPLAEQHCLMEAIREASIRTANEAGDGTTTATILARSFSDLTEDYLAKHPEASPRLVCQDISDTFETVMKTEISMQTIAVDLEMEEVGDPLKDGSGGTNAKVPTRGRRAARAVAFISGNGDAALADAVMKCFDIAGDDGNVTITETTGDPSYQVSKVQGFPLATGYELSTAKYFPAFINDPGTQKVILDKPVFVLYYGRINDIQTVLPLMNKLQEAWDGDYMEPHNVVLVATGFSEAVLAGLSYNFVTPKAINIYPVVVPQTPFNNGTRNFLDDLAAVVGGEVFDPLTNRVEAAQLEQIGNLAKDEVDNVWKARGVNRFEATRYRSTVLGYCSETLLKRRAITLRTNLEAAESAMDADYLRERLGKLTGGIAHLKVIGSSNGELKERRDRAEDAVCAVRGALQHGSLPGGGWGLMRLRYVLPDTAVNEEIVKPALLAPVRRLLSNAGLNAAAVESTIKTLEESVGKDGPATAFNALTRKFVAAEEDGLLDSTPAVREALKNAISSATLYGTLGGIIVQARDRDFELSDSRDAAEFDRMVNSNPADERA